MIKSKLTRVRLNRVPGWFRLAAYKAIREGRWQYDGPQQSVTADGFLRYAMLHGFWTLFDHWGSADGELVSEPYRSVDTQELITLAKRFAATFELEYRIQPESTWAPSRTLRITFWPEGPIAKMKKSLKKIDDAENRKTCPACGRVFGRNPVLTFAAWFKVGTPGDSDIVHHGCRFTRVPYALRKRSAVATAREDGVRLDGG